MSGFEEGVVFAFGFGGGGDAGGADAAAATLQPAPPPPPPAGLGPGGAVAWEVFPPIPDADDGADLIPVDVAGPLLPGPPLRRTVVSSTAAAAALAQERGGTPAATTPTPTTIASASDLIPRVYEGGFKAWEGGEALARLLAGDGRPGAPVWVDAGAGTSSGLAAAARAAVVPPSALVGAAVLELGAGAALPSLVAARRGAATLDVADYNPSVLARVTAVNVRDARVACPVRYWAGDWAGLPELLVCGGGGGGGGPHARRSFSLVLAAEVGYAPDSVAGLAACLAGVLGGSGGGRDDPAPLALLAVKRHYFGVGGGSAALVDALRCAAGGGLEAGVVASTDGAVPVDVVAVRRQEKGR